MRSNTYILGLAWGVAAIGAQQAIAQPLPGWHFVGFPTGGLDSAVYGLSADGTVAAGWSVVAGAGQKGFTWTAALGRHDFGLESGMPVNTPTTGISPDGNAAVGSSGTGASDARAFRWRGTGNFQTLGVLGGYQSSYASGASDGGSVVVGRCETSDGILWRAFRWTEQSGMQPIPLAPGTNSASATAVSADGGVTVGFAGISGGAGFAFRYSPGSPLVVLPGLSTTPTSAAYGTNPDGDIAVGRSGEFGTTPVAWFGISVVNLGLPAGATGATALCVNDDGSVIAGSAGNGITGGAAVWTLARGPERLADYVRAMGIPVPADAFFTNCHAVSADGLTFAGEGFYNGRTQGFVVTVPGPGALGTCVLGIAGPFRRTRQSPA